MKVSPCKQTATPQPAPRYNTSAYLSLKQHGEPIHAKAFIQKLRDSYSSYTRCSSFVLISHIVCFLARQPPAGQGLLIHEVSRRSRTTTLHSRLDLSRRVISSSQRPLPDNTQHSQKTDFHDPSGSRTHNLSRRAAADLCLRPSGHWDRPISCIMHYNSQRATSDFMSEVLVSANIRGKTSRTSVLGEHTDWRFVGVLNDIYVNLYCDRVQSSRRIPKFSQNTLPSSSRLSADGGSTFLRNYDALLPIYTISKLERPTQCVGTLWYKPSLARIGFRETPSRDGETGVWRRPACVDGTYIPSTPHCNYVLLGYYIA